MGKILLYGASDFNIETNFLLLIIPDQPPRKKCFCFQWGWSFRNHAWWYIFSFKTM